MDLAAEIRQLAESKLANESHFVVDVVISSRQGPRKVMICIEGDQGVSIDDCADLSRAIAQHLDETGLIEDAYTLEVSTPGIDQPLKSARQYKRNVGRKLKVRLKDKTLEGKLVEANEERIVLEQESGSGKKKEVKAIEIPFSEIERTIVMVSFK